MEKLTESLKDNARMKDMLNYMLYTICLKALFQ